MEYEAILPQYVDSTMMSTFGSCPQKFFDEFVLGLRGAPSIDLHAGGVFSGALEYYNNRVWRDKETPDQALTRTFGQWAHMWGDFTIPPHKVTQKTREHMWEAFQDYLRKYPPLTDHIQPYTIANVPTYEFSFAIPLDDPRFPRHPISGDPFIYVGRADLLGHYMGKPCIRDEKTAGKLEANWSEKWDMRAQFLGYLWAARQMGFPKIDTVFVRGIICTKEVKQVEAQKVYADWEIDRWYYQLSRNLHRLVKCWNDNYWDYDLGEACVQYGHCQFMPLCKSRNPQNWYSTFTVRRWNPLNRNQDAETLPPTAKPIILPQKLEILDVV